MCGRVFMTLLAVVVGCGANAAPVIKLQYELLTPMSGAEKEAVHGGRVGAGMVSTGSGTNVGVTVGARVRPTSDQAGGGSFDANLLTAYVPMSSRLPFVVGEWGLGLLGSTILTRDDGSGDIGNTFDLLTPHGHLGIGYGLGKGFAISLGASMHYLWHVHNDFKPGSNQLLMGFGISFGLFDPRVSSDEHLLAPLLR